MSIHSILFILHAILFKNEKKVKSILRRERLPRKVGDPNMAHLSFDVFFDPV
jgi:hypothetical protein